VLLVGDEPPHAFDDHVAARAGMRRDLRFEIGERARAWPRWPLASLGRHDAMCLARRRSPARNP
jgi:hypothetical protein